MKIKFGTKSFGIATAQAAIAAMLFAGCSATSTGASGLSSKDVVASGTVTVPHGPLSARQGRDINPADIFLNQFDMYCATIQATPTHGRGSLTDHGVFSVVIPDAKGAKISCSLLARNTARGTDVPVARLLVVDNTSQDVNGNPDSSTTVSLTKDANMGDIALDLGSGTVSAPLNQFPTGSVDTTPPSGTTYWDATGNWVAAAIDPAAIPAGYHGLCPSRSSGRNNNCNGPTLNESLYIKQITGTNFTNGSPGTEPRYGLSIWNSQADFASCGSVLGTSYAADNAHGVDFSTSGLAQGPFTFISSLNGTDVLTNGYESNQATAHWDVRDCHNTHFPNAVNGHDDNGWICHDSTDSSYQINLSGGCKVTSTHQPIEIDDWHSITWNSPNGCTNSVSTEHTNFKINTCIGTYAPPSPGTAVGVTCTNEYAYAANPVDTNHVVPSDIDTSNSVVFNGNNVTQILAKDGFCSDTLSGHDLDKARCYAEYYQRYTEQHHPTGCVRKIRTNWTATDVAGFIHDTDKPEARFVSAYYKIDSAGQGSLTNSEDDYEGVQTGDAWIDCHIRRVDTVTFSPKTRDIHGVVTEVTATLGGDQYLVDSEKPACVAYFQAHGGTQVTVGAISLWTLHSDTMFQLNRPTP